MSSNAFDMVRKVRHLPGLKLTAVIEVQSISKRVKSSAQKMLRSGVITSGYLSKSRMLAEQLLRDACVDPSAYCLTRGVIVYPNAYMTDEARKYIRELIETARMIELAGTSSARTQAYINERYEYTLGNLLGSERCMFGLNSAAIHAQIAAVAASYRSPEQVEAHAKLADKLDGTEPIAINFHD